MKETEKENSEENKEISAEQMAEFRKKAINELQEEIKYLKVEAEYQELLMQIETYKANRLKAIMAQHHMTRPPEESESKGDRSETAKKPPKAASTPKKESQPNSETQKRTLKQE